MLKIERSVNGGVVLRLSGRIVLGDIDELRQLFSFETVDRQLALDLKDVTLVDRDAVIFLARCEGDGIKLRNCPGYVRKWLENERDKNR